MDERMLKAMHELARNVVYTLGADPGSITTIERMIREAVAKALAEAPPKAA